jgi:hypothetical protein
MSRSARPFRDVDGRPMAVQRIASGRGDATETMDDAERNFLEPVARYLAIWFQLVRIWLTSSNLLI